MSDLDDLEEKLHAAEHRDEPSDAERKASEDAENKRVGLQAGMEFTGSIAVGVLIGVGLDNWLGTKPIFMLVFFFLGVFTGFFNIYRVTSNLGSSVGFSELHRRQKDAKTSPTNENALKDTE